MDLSRTLALLAQDTPLQLSATEDAGTDWEEWFQEPRDVQKGMKQQTCSFEVRSYLIK